MNMNKITTFTKKSSDNQATTSTLSSHNKLDILALEKAKMNDIKDIAKYHLFHEFKQCAELKFNGELKFISPQGKTWNFYYRLGHLIWATEGNHISRRLRRYVHKYCPNVNLNKLHLLSDNTTLDYWDNQIEEIILITPEDANLEYWDYQILQTLYRSKQISKEQFCTITESTILELIFDIMQELNNTALRCQTNQDSILDGPLISMNANVLLSQIENFWGKWIDAGLANYSPNLAPIIKKSKLLKKQFSPDAYKTLEFTVTGDYTLWDLAFKMQKNVFSVAASLLPLIRQGIIEFREVPDLPLFSRIPKAKKFNTPLVACVDDSSHICEIIEDVVTNHGMRFIKIQDPVEALPILIQSKPDFIFLNLMMPGLNGYELCRNLRRTNCLSQTPIVMLTDSDGVFDKVRSKLFGATDLINKPINENIVIDTINKYLSSTSQTHKIHQQNTCSHFLQVMTT